MLDFRFFFLLNFDELYWVKDEVVVEMNFFSSDLQIMQKVLGYHSSYLKGWAAVARG